MPGRKKEKMTLLHKIITNGNNRFYRFSNADGKAWAIPVKNMRVAFGLYQPSGIKGKVVKALLPLLHHISAVRKAVKADTLHCSLKKELNDLLYKLFGVQEIEFAIFEGTPCVHQKITMQLSSGNKILGYCKASDNSDILALFEKEYHTLQHLAGKGVTGIPTALYCGTLSNGVHVFVQNTIKSAQSKVPHNWGALHEKFLASLHEKTKQALLFEESDYYHIIHALREHIDWLPANTDKQAVARAIDEITAKHIGKKVEYSACHSDFTPWNMFVEKGELFVFDFEYASLTCPPGLDAVHFAMQTAVFEKHLRKEEIASMLLHKFDRDAIIMYLLDIISRFTLREKGPVNGDTHLFAIWGYLLKTILLLNKA